MNGLVDGNVFPGVRLAERSGELERSEGARSRIGSWSTWPTPGSRSAFACLIAVPVGLLIGHTRRGEFVAVSVANLGRAIPSFAILSIVFQLMLSMPATQSIAFGPGPIVVAMFLLVGPADPHEHLRRHPAGRPRHRRGRPRHGHDRRPDPAAARGAAGGPTDHDGDPDGRRPGHRDGHARRADRRRRPRPVIVDGFAQPAIPTRSWAARSSCRPSPWSPSSCSAGSRAWPRPDDEQADPQPAASGRRAAQRRSRTPRNAHSTG